MSFIELSTGFNHETNEFIRSRRGDRWPSSFPGISCLSQPKLLKPIGACQLSTETDPPPPQEPRSSVTVRKTWRKLVETLLLLLLLFLFLFPPNYKTTFFELSLPYRINCTLELGHPRSLGLFTRCSKFLFNGENSTDIYIYIYKLNLGGSFKCV